MTAKSQQTLAFIFSPNLAQVLLLKVTKPTWQQGKYNGIGGKVQLGETTIVACLRELVEEASVTISPENLINYGELIGDNWHVHLFTARAADLISTHRTNEGVTEWVSTNSLPKSCIENLAWLIPCAKLHLTHPHQPYLIAKYPDHKLEERKTLQ